VRLQPMAHLGLVRLLFNLIHTCAWSAGILLLKLRDMPLLWQPSVLALPHTQQQSLRSRRGDWRCAWAASPRLPQVCCCFPAAGRG
jgi:hypothetical protein